MIIKDVAGKGLFDVRGTILGINGIVIADHTWLDVSSFMPNASMSFCFCARGIEIAIERQAISRCSDALRESCSKNPDQSLAVGTAYCFVECHCPVACLPLLKRSFCRCHWFYEKCISVKLKLLGDGYPTIRCATTFFHTRHECVNQTRGVATQLSVFVF